MTKPANRIVTNRKSPRNEQDYIQAYKSQNPASKRSDHLDISAVKTKDGTLGHALLNQKLNRAQDKNPHIGKAFIPDSQLKKDIKKK